MRHVLHIHPDYRCEAVEAIEADIARSTDGILRLTYRLSGDIAAIRVPPPAAPKRTDQLWQHTVFEAFLRPPGGTAYCEFNFSPSTDWAAYRFRSRRSGMASIFEVEAPRIALHTTADMIECAVEIDVSAVPDLPQQEPWRTGLTTIVEENRGQKTFWALAHPQGKPDFHHDDGFVLDLPAPKQT